MIVFSRDDFMVLVLIFVGLCLFSSFFGSMTVYKIFSAEIEDFKRYLAESNKKEGK